MDLALAATVYRRAVIGGVGDVPWRREAECRLYGRVVEGKPLIMGRRTYEALGGLLPLGDAVVVSRDPAFFPRDVMVRSTISAAYNACARLAKGLSAREAVVIGGATIFRLALPVTDRVYLALVDEDREGGRHFPLLPPARWRPALAGPQYRPDGTTLFELRTYERRPEPAPGPEPRSY
ncbi:MAG: dihydrofolate reductase [Acetobacterales bacterium]